MTNLLPFLVPCSEQTASRQRKSCCCIGKQSPSWGCKSVCKHKIINFNFWCPIFAHPVKSYMIIPLLDCTLQHKASEFRILIWKEQTWGECMHWSPASSGNVVVFWLLCIIWFQFTPLNTIIWTSPFSFIVMFAALLCFLTAILLCACRKIISVVNHQVLAAETMWTFHSGLITLLNALILWLAFLACSSAGCSVHIPSSRFRFLLQSVSYLVTHHTKRAKSGRGSHLASESGRS